MQNSLLLNLYVILLKNWELCPTFELKTSTSRSNKIISPHKCRDIVEQGISFLAPFLSSLFFDRLAGKLSLSALPFISPNIVDHPCAFRNIFLVSFFLLRWVNLIILRFSSKTLFLIFLSKILFHLMEW